MLPCYLLPVTSPMGTPTAPDQILSILGTATSPVTLQELKAALPEVGDQILKNALSRMVKREQIERVGSGSYGVTGNTCDPVTPVTQEVLPVTVAEVLPVTVAEVLPVTAPPVMDEILVSAPRPKPVPGVATDAPYVRTQDVEQTPEGYVIEGKPLPEGCFVHPETIRVVEIPTTSLSAAAVIEAVSTDGKPSGKTIRNALTALKATGRISQDGRGQYRGNIPRDADTADVPRDIPSPTIPWDIPSPTIPRDIPSEPYEILVSAPRPATAPQVTTDMVKELVEESLLDMGLGPNLHHVDAVAADINAVIAPPIEKEAIRQALLEIHREEFERPPGTPLRFDRPL